METEEVRLLKSKKNKNKSSSGRPPSADLIERTSKRKKKLHSSTKSEVEGAKPSGKEEVKTQATMIEFATALVNDSNKIARKKKQKSRTSHKIMSKQSKDVTKGGKLSSIEGGVKNQAAMGEFTEAVAVNAAEKVSRKKKFLASNAENKTDKPVVENNINKSTKDDYTKVGRNKRFQSGAEGTAKEANAELVDEICDVDMDCSKKTKSKSDVSVAEKVSRKKKKSLGSNAKNKTDMPVIVNNINKLMEDGYPKRGKSKRFNSGAEGTAKEANAELVDEICDVDTDCSKGMKKWLSLYWSRRPGLKVLQDNIDQFLMAHEATEEKARKEREALAEEGGWTVVVHHKGRKKTTDAETGVTVGSVAQAAVMENLAKKKQKEVPLDFYRFQKREARRSEIMQLQSKFEQEKKRIQQLRAARKFRPY